MTPVGATIRFVELGSGGWGRRAGELYAGRWPFYTNANRKLVAEGKAVVYPQYFSKCNRSINGGTRSGLVCSVAVFSAMGIFTIP